MLLLDKTKHGIIKMVSHRYPGSDKLAEELIFDLPSIILLGNRGYKSVVDAVLEKMETEGEGKLEGNQDLRYQHLKAHQFDLQRLWTMDRRSASAWDQLTDTLSKLAHGLAHVKAAEIAAERGRMPARQLLQ